MDTTSQAQPAASTPAPDANVVALDSYRVANSAALSNPNHAEHGKALAQYRELAGKAFPDDAPEAANKPAAQVAPSSSAAPVATPSALDTLNAYRNAHASELFGRNPDRFKVAEYNKLAEAAFPDSAAPNDASIDLPDSLTTAALASASDVPDSPEKYRFDDLRPAGMQIDKALDSEVRNLFHEMGLSQSAARTLVLEWEKASEVARIAGRPLTETEIMNRRDVVAQELRQLWGPDAGRKADLALSVIAALPADKRDRVAELLVASGLNNSKAVVVHLAGLAEARAVKSKR